MKNTIFVYLFLVTSVLASCAEQKSSEKVVTNPPLTYTGLQKKLNEANFYCASDLACPANVGLILINVNGSSIYPEYAQCTGFLISENIVATSSHCLPDHVKQSKRCEDQIAVRFLDKSKKQNVFKCQEVLQYSSLVRNSIYYQDFAFFRIEATETKPLKMAQNGLNHNQKISVQKVTPLNQNSIGGRLEVENCKVGLNTLLNMKSTNSWSQTAVGMGCGGIAGNSGAPILNEENKVIGMLNGHVNDDYTSLLKNAFKVFKLAVPATVPKHFVFTNLSCVPDPKTGAFEKERCTYGESPICQE